MDFEIGSTVETITALFLGRWIHPFEQGIVEGKHCSPAGQEVFDVRLTDGNLYTFAPGEIEETKETQ